MTKKQKIVVHSKGDFLNRPGHHLDAAIFTSIWVEVDKNWVSSEVNLKLNDCSRIVNLSLSIDDDEEEYQNSLYKVDALIENLKELRKALPKGRALYLKMKKENDERNKTKSSKDSGSSPY